MIKGYVEKYEIDKNYDVTLTDVDEESEKEDKINRKEEEYSEYETSETDERNLINISDLLNIIGSQKKDDDDLGDTDIGWETSDEKSEEIII